MSPAAEHLRESWDLVIFDCDGVLVDSEPIANEILQRALSGLGLRLDLEEVAAMFVGMTIAECLKVIEAATGCPPPAGFFEDWRAALYEEFRKRPVAAVVGVEAALDVLADLDMPTCVVSNGPMIKMQTTLAVTGLLSRFGGRLFSPDSGLPGKPAPDLFLVAAAFMSADPRRTAVIEDTGTGARGACAAGMTVFGYVGGALSHADALAAEGAHLFDDMRELPALLRKHGA